jgi:hypothetical protein
MLKVSCILSRTGSLKAATSTQPDVVTAQAKNLTMCPYMQSSVGQCPILHKCAFAHSEEEVAKNEQFARWALHAGLGCSALPWHAVLSFHACICFSTY